MPFVRHQMVKWSRWNSTNECTFPSGCVVLCWEMGQFETLSEIKENSAEELKFTDSIEKNHEMSAPAFFICEFVYLRGGKRESVETFTTNIKRKRGGLYDIFNGGDAASAPHTMCIINGTILSPNVYQTSGVNRPTILKLTFCSHKPHKPSCWLWPVFFFVLNQNFWSAMNLNMFTRRHNKFFLFFGSPHSKIFCTPIPSKVPFLPLFSIFCSRIVLLSLFSYSFCLRIIQIKTSRRKKNLANKKMVGSNRFVCGMF